MRTSTMVRVRTLNRARGNNAEVLVTCASFEDRCLGIPRLLAPECQFDEIFVCVYDDSSEARQENVEAIRTLLAGHGPVVMVPTSEANPAHAIGELLGLIRGLLSERDATVTVDISTFTKRHLLLLLQSVDDARLWDSLRLLYTEPKDYVVDMYLPMSVGIKHVAPIPGFTTLQPADRPVLLAIMLGYEGDRAMSLFQTIEPNETVLFVPRRAYRPEWQGRTEELNGQLIALVGNDAIEYADSRDPTKVRDSLTRVLTERYEPGSWTVLVSPLGTKPQTVGLYLYWRANRDSFTIVYAQPLRHNERFYSRGVGPTWEFRLR